MKKIGRRGGLGDDRKQPADSGIDTGAVQKQGLIVRPALIDRLLDDRHGCVVVEAPAGYGKTTLLREAGDAALRRGIDVSWIALAADGAEPASIRRRIAVAVDPEGIHSGEGDMAAWISAALDQRRSPLLLCIDAEDEGVDLIMPLVEMFVSQGRGRLRFAIATRRHPGAGLARMRAAENLDVIGRADLALTHEEARGVLGEDVPAGNLQLIMERTEGWPILIKLVKQFLRRRELHWRSAATFTGHTPELADYFAECVVAGFNGEAWDALIRIAVCDRFNGDLINHLCGRTDGWALIDLFQRQGLPIAPVDAAGQWFRFPSLFTEFLVGRLRREADQELAELHRAAAQWFAGASDFDEAVRHAHAAGDTALTTRLLIEAGGWLTAFRGGTHLLRIIGELPDSALTANPYLRLGQIYLLAQEGRLREARTLFTALTDETAAAAFALPDEYALFETSAGALDAVLRVYEVRRVNPAALLALRASSQALPPALAAMITHLLGFAYYGEGNFAEARRTLPAAADQCRSVGAEFVAGYSYLALGDTHLEMGEPERATHYFDLVVDIARHSFGADSNQALAGRVFLAEVAHERGELDRAAALIEGAIGDIERRDPWFSVYIAAHRVASAAIGRKRGWRAAVEFLDEAYARLERHDLLDAYAPYLNLQKAEILMTAGQLDAAQRLLALVPGESGERPGRIELFRDIAAGRLAILRKQPGDALTVLQRNIPQLALRRHVRRLIKLHALVSAAHRVAGNMPEAQVNLDQAIDLAKAGELWMPIAEEAALLGPLPASISRLSSPTSRPARSPKRSGTVSLGPREHQILELLAEGMSGKEMANAIHLSVSTVRTYRKNLYRKLAVNSRSGAIATGRKTGLL